MRLRTDPLPPLYRSTRRALFFGLLLQYYSTTAQRSRTACLHQILLLLRHKYIFQRAARSRSQVSAPTSMSKSMTIVLQVLDSAQCTPVTQALTCRSCPPHPPTFTWMLGPIPHALRQWPASSGRLYGASLYIAWLHQHWFSQDANDSVRKHGNSDINPDSAELARLAILGDPKQEAYLNVEPFAFKPLQLVNLVSSKSLENLGSLGGVEGLLHGLGTNRLRGLGKRGSPDPAIINPVTPYGVEMTPITLRAGVSEGLQGAASPSVGHFASIKFSTTQDATIEDRQRIYGQNIFPQRPSKPLLFMMWSALHNKVLVSPKTFHLFPCI